ncbi:MAG: hypothetical protein WCJ72_16580, partial [Chryseobacterium sp.]
LGNILNCKSLAALSSLFFSWSKYSEQDVTWPGVGLLWITLMIVAYSFTIDISPLLTGVSWLLISLVGAELKDYQRFIPKNILKHNQTNMYLAFFGLMSLFLFLIRFFLVDMSNEALAFGVLRIRILSEILSLAVFVFWLKFSENLSLKIVASFVNYLLELTALSVTFYFMYEIREVYYPLVWSSMSVLCFYIGIKYKDFNRLMLYGYFYYFACLFNIAFISTTISSPSNLFLDQSWVMGLGSIFLCTLFMVFAFKKQKSMLFSEINLPRRLKKLEFLQRSLDRFQLRFFLYPLSVSVAFFLFWSFDKTILSLLWIIECFLLFLISIVMREPQFRVVSMVGVGVVFMRIVFYDLTGKDFFVKAIVFILVGVILIAMNAIYNKYKYRYESKQVEK